MSDGDNGFGVGNLAFVTGWLSLLFSFMAVSSLEEKLGGGWIVAIVLGGVAAYFVMFNCLVKSGLKNNPRQSKKEVTDLAAFMSSGVFLFMWMCATNPW